MDDDQGCINMKAFSVSLDSALTASLRPDYVLHHTLCCWMIGHLGLLFLVWSMWSVLLHLENNTYGHSATARSKVCCWSPTLTSQNTNSYSIWSLDQRWKALSTENDMFYCYVEYVTILRQQWSKMPQNTEYAIHADYLIWQITGVCAQ